MRLRKFLLTICIGIGFIGLSGCSTVQVHEYAKEQPVLRLEDYFNGTVDIDGFFQKRSGQVVKRFHCVMLARWEGSVGTLDETFTYSDGTTSRRVWTIRKTGSNSYVGTAADVIGEARGETAGNAFYWTYVLDLEVDGSRYHVKMDDWMFLMNDRILINRTAMSKFGIHLGDLTIVMTKRAG